MLVNSLVADQRLMKYVKPVSRLQPSHFWQSQGYPFGLDSQPFDTLTNLSLSFLLYLEYTNEVVVLGASVLVSGDVVDHRDSAIPWDWVELWKDAVLHIFQYMTVLGWPYGLPLAFSGRLTHLEAGNWLGKIIVVSHNIYDLLIWNV